MHFTCFYSQCLLLVIISKLCFAIGVVLAKAKSQGTTIRDMESGKADIESDGDSGGGADSNYNDAPWRLAPSPPTPIRAASGSGGEADSNMQMGSDGGCTLTPSGVDMLERAYNERLADLEARLQEQRDEANSLKERCHQQQMEIDAWWTDFNWREKVKADHKNRGPGGFLTTAAKFCRFLNDNNYEDASTLADETLRCTPKEHNLWRCWELNSISQCHLYL